MLGNSAVRFIAEGSSPRWYDCNHFSVCYHTIFAITYWIPLDWYYTFFKPTITNYLTNTFFCRLFTPSQLTPTRLLRLTHRIWQFPIGSQSPSCSPPVSSVSGFILLSCSWSPHTRSTITPSNPRPVLIPPNGAKSWTVYATFEVLSDKKEQHSDQATDITECFLSTLVILKPWQSATVPQPGRLIQRKMPLIDTPVGVFTGIPWSHHIAASVPKLISHFLAEVPFFRGVKVPPIGHGVWTTIGVSLRREYRFIGAAVLAAFEPILSRMPTDPSDLEKLRAWSQSEQEASYEELSRMLWKLVFEGIGASGDAIDMFSEIQRYTTALNDSHPKPVGTMPPEVAHKQSWGTLRGLNIGRNKLGSVLGGNSSGRTPPNGQRQ